MKITRWTTEKAEKELAKRFKRAVQYRKLFEGQWKKNEKYLFPVGNIDGESLGGWNSTAELLQLMQNSAGDATSISLPRIKKNVRYLHAQMSANPPSAVALPESSDETCRRAAAAARHIMKWGSRQYMFQEVQDMTALSTVSLGTGVARLSQDPNKGKVVEFDEKTGEVTVEGDISHRWISLWDFWVGQNAKVANDIEETWTKETLPWDEAMARFPNQAELLESCVINPHNADMEEWGDIGAADILRNGTAKETDAEKKVEILEYHQKGHIFNANLGYHCFHTKEGKLLSPLVKNPEPKACIPYATMTDLDMPGHFYGKSTVDFAIPIMLVVDSIDTMVLDNLETHGNLKLVVYEGSEVNDDDLNTNPHQVIRVSGTAQQAPTTVNMPALALDFYKLRDNLLAAIDEIMGINEVIQGQFQKDMSGFSAQTAINAANLVRRRLFNKYTMYTEKVNQLLLDNVALHWATKRKLPVVGTEDSDSIAEYDKSSVASGFILQVQYGQNFSLDPAMRREEIMQSIPVLKEAGVNPKTIARMLKWNEVEGLFDEVEIARNRQLEIFQKAIELYEGPTSKVEVMPATDMTYAAHDLMAEAAMQYFMTKEYLKLDPELKKAMYQHYKERLQCAALMATGKEPTAEAVAEAMKAGDAPAAPAAAPGAPVGPGGPPQIPGLPPMPGAPAAAPMGAAPAGPSPMGDAGVVI